MHANRQDAQTPRLLLSWCIAVAALLNLSCGGGGGGGSGSGPGSTSTGLVPVAPPVGEVLVADAGSLRVLRPGAIWRYNGNLNGTPFTEIVTHASGGTGVDEITTNSTSGVADPVNVRNENGTIRARFSLADVGIPEVIDAIELRSPVRRNDQFTIVDRRIVDAVPDLDGDGKAETLDLAAWTIVIGQETLDLAIRRNVRTVRVESRTAARVRLSASGGVGETVTAQQTIWYAEGIGVVRLSSLTPGNTPLLMDSSVQELESWDGVSAGWGALPAVAAVRPGSTAPLRDGRCAVALDDRAVVMTDFGGTSTRGFSLASVGLRGTVSSVHDHNGERLDGEELFPVFPNCLVRVGNSVRLLARQTAGNGDLAMLAFNADGSRTADPAVRLIAGPLSGFDPFGSPEVVAASWGEKLWLMWSRQTPGNVGPPFAVDLLLQGFSSNGTPLGPATVIESGVSGIGVPSLAAHASSVVATWIVASGTRYGVFDSSNGALLAQRPLPGVIGQTNPALATDNLLALATTPGTAFGSASVARLDANFDLVTAAGGDLAGENITPSWLSGSATTRFDALPDGLFVSQIEQGRRWPWETNAYSILTIVEFPIRAGRLAESPAVQIVARQPIGTDNFNVAGSLYFPDRVLLYGGSFSTPFGFVVAWRPR